MTGSRIAAIVVVVMIALSAIAASSIGDGMAGAWMNIFGRTEAPGRLAILTVLPSLAVALLAGAHLAPRIDPFGRNYREFEGTYWFVVLWCVVFLGGVHALVLAQATGLAGDGGGLLLAFAGLVILVIGNVLTRVQRNWFIGIRTPWTISSDVVWRRTHRLAGRLLVAGGLTLMIAASRDPGWPVLPAASVMLAIVATLSLVYSYLTWRRLGGGDR